MGTSQSKTELAWLKLSGYGDAGRDVDGAVVLLEERVKAGDGEAMWMLGLCKEYGNGTEKDVEGAEKLYGLSKRAGNAIGGFLALKTLDMMRMKLSLTGEQMKKVLMVAPWTELYCGSDEKK